MQTAKNLLYLRKHLYKSQTRIIDYLVSHQDAGFIPTKQIIQDVGLSKRVTCKTLKSLYDLFLIDRERVSFKAVKNGGRRFQYMYKADIVAINCLPQQHRTKTNFLLELKKKDSNLFCQLFDFQEKKNE